VLSFVVIGETAALVVAVVIYVSQMRMCLLSSADSAACPSLNLFLLRTLSLLPTFIFSFTFSYTYSYCLPFTSSLASYYHSNPISASIVLPRIWSLRDFGPYLNMWLQSSPLLHVGQIPRSLCRIRGLHSCDYDDSCLLDYNAV
jgi:hypothetical protein